MAAGTVISGGFPGRVAQEVQPNPKCSGCLHFDGQGGRTGICTIGTKPWMCGDGDAQDIGFAPIARGAGKYLPDMSNHSVQAREVETQFVSDLYGSGSTRPVKFQEVKLNEGHSLLVKSYYDRYMEMQRTMCRLHQGHGQSYGMAAPSNFDAQVCSCSNPSTRDMAKSLVPQLGNRERAMLEFEDVVEFVEDVVRAGFQRIEKAVFPAGKYGKFVTSHVGDKSGTGMLRESSGRMHVHFHPADGSEPVHVGTSASPAYAKKLINGHQDRMFRDGGNPPKQLMGSDEKSKDYRKPAQIEAIEEHRPSAGGGGSSSGVPKSGLRQFLAGTSEGHTLRHQPSESGAVTKPVKTKTGAAALSMEKALSWKHEGDTMHAKAPHGTYQVKQGRMKQSGRAPADARHKLLYSPASGGGQRLLGYHPDQGSARTAARAHNGKQDVRKGPYIDSTAPGGPGRGGPKPGQAPNVTVGPTSVRHFKLRSQERNTPRDVRASATPTDQVKPSRQHVVDQSWGGGSIPNPSPQPRRSGQGAVWSYSKAEIQMPVDASPRQARQAKQFADALTGGSPSASRRPSGGDVSPKPGVQPAGSPLKYMGMPTSPRVPQDPYADPKPPKGQPRVGKQSKPAASPKVPTMSASGKKEERSSERVSYKALDSIARLTKALDEITKAEHSFSPGQLVVHNPSADSNDHGTIGTVGRRSSGTHVHFRTASGSPRMIHHSELRAASNADIKHHASAVHKLHGLGFTG